MSTAMSLKGLAAANRHKMQLSVLFVLIRSFVCFHQFLMNKSCVIIGTTLIVHSFVTGQADTRSEAIRIYTHILRILHMLIGCRPSIHRSSDTWTFSGAATNLKVGRHMSGAKCR